MKRLIIPTAFLILCTAIFQLHSSDEVGYTTLKPEPQHPRVVQLVAQILTKNHYKNMDLDDTLSSQVLSNYLELLDYNRSFFLKRDIEEFEEYRHKFDEFLLSGRLDAVYNIFNRYQQRVGERVEYIYNRLEQPFDFAIDEYFYPYRDSVDWATNPAELDEYWRKRLKNEALSLKLAGKEPDEITERLRERYDNLERRLRQYESEDVIQVYLNGLARVFDPHTNYFSPKATDDFKIRMSLSLEGIGARLMTENDYTKVVEIVPGGPADKSGLLEPNEYIIGVGQDEEGEIVDVIGWRIDDVVQLIRGPKGTKVRLQILHDQNDLITDAEIITITRDKVKLEDSAAKSDTLHIDYRGKQFVLGVIDIPTFYLDFEAQRNGDPNYKSTTRDVLNILAEMEQMSVDGIIIDLRGNGGGFLSEALELTGLFIDKGPVVQVKDLRGRITVEKDENPGVSYNGPMAVLVDEFSASASEIFAAAIQDYERGVIIGSQTYGKGTVQNATNLSRFYPNSPDKLGQVKYTVAKFYRVNGGSTQHVGVIPDIELPSRFEHEEIGESSQKNALLWDEIASANYNISMPAVDGFLSNLKNNSQERLAGNGKFAEYLNDIKEARERRENKKISLNEEKRRAEREKKRNEEEEAEEEKIDKNALILRESARILTDYILLRNS